MSLAIAELFGTEWGVISGENQYQRSGERVRLSRYKVFVSGKFAFGIVGYTEPLHTHILRSEYSSFNECVNDITQFLQPWKNGDPAFISLTIMGFDPHSQRVRCLYLNSQDYFEVKELMFTGRLSSGVGDDLANEFLAKRYSPYLPPAADEVAKAHMECYRHVSANNSDVSPESLVAIVTRDGASLRWKSKGAPAPENGQIIHADSCGVLMKGSVPPSLSALALNGMTWTTTTTSVTFSWTQTPIYRADGSVSSPIAGGSQNVTGLAASQNYFAYPYFDEVSGTLKWVDSTLVFPTMTSVGFNGTSQYLTTTTSLTNLPTAFSIEFWFKSSSTGSQKTVLSLFSPQTGTGAPTHEDALVTVGPGGEINLQYVNGTGVQSATTSGAGTQDGAWHHIVISFAVGGTITIYVDSVVKGTASALGAPRNAGFALWYHIGFGPANASFLTTSNNFFNGSLSHIAVYHGTALTAAQVSNHFIAGINQGFTVYASIVATDSATYYWKLNESSGTSAADSIASNTGTYVAAPTLNQQAPVVVPLGSPAILWPYKNFLCSQAQALQSRIPLSAGSLTPSTPATGGGSGGGGGLGGGGLGGCFSGNTRVRTNRGTIPIEQVRPGDLVTTARGTLRRVIRVLKHDVTDADTYAPVEPGCSPIVKRRAPDGSWLVTDMGAGEMVTLNHSLLDKGQWKRAHEILGGTLAYPLPVYNLEIEHNKNEDPLAPDAECSFVLGNGRTAHNFYPK